MPIAVTAMAISFGLKVRCEDWKFKTFLISQYILLTFVSLILYVVGRKFDSGSILVPCINAIILAGILVFALSVRSRIASLPEEELSFFITTDVVKGGVFIGLAQLAFLMFGSIQCDGNSTGYMECRRTLYSQVGLSAMVSLYIIIKLISGAVP